ncbi:MAG: hypothetical protein QOH88_3119 [Verrucomicrobiota bacterium]|jgi:hypothetical protein
MTRDTIQAAGSETSLGLFDDQTPHHLKLGQWADAARALLHAGEGKAVLYRRSLVCRLLDDYDAEKAIIATGLTCHPHWEYMLERKHWHELPLFDKLEPRPSLILDRCDEETPPRELVDQMCFVTCGNSSYFTLLIECLESIAATRLYGNVPVCVVDCGLSVEENTILRKRFKQIQAVVEPRTIVPTPTITSENLHFEASWARAHFTALFPGYRYYLWIDADAWVQDERGIDAFLSLAAAQGIALPVHPFKVRVAAHHHWLRRNTLTETQRTTVMGAEAVIACIFCVDANANLYREFTEIMCSNIGQLGPSWGVDQEVLLYLTAKYRLNNLPTEYAYEAAPRCDVTSKYPHALYTQDGTLIRVYHLGGGLRSERKWRYFVPVYLRETCAESVPTLASVHFRVWPWREKKTVEELLRNAEL